MKKQPSILLAGCLVLSLLTTACTSKPDKPKEQGTILASTTEQATKTQLIEEDTTLQEGDAPSVIEEEQEPVLGGLQFVNHVAGYTLHYPDSYTIEKRSVNETLFYNDEVSLYLYTSATTCPDTASLINATSPIIYDSVYRYPDAEYDCITYTATTPMDQQAGNWNGQLEPIYIKLKGEGGGAILDPEAIAFYMLWHQKPLVFVATSTTLDQDTLAGRVISFAAGLQEGCAEDTTLSYTLERIEHKPWGISFEAPAEWEDEKRGWFGKSAPSDADNYYAECKIMIKKDTKHTLDGLTDEEITQAIESSIIDAASLYNYDRETIGWKTELLDQQPVTVCNMAATMYRYKTTVVPTAPEYGKCIPETYHLELYTTRCYFRLDDTTYVFASMYPDQCAEEMQNLFLETLATIQD